MRRHTISLLKGERLTVVADTITSGHIVRENTSAGGEPQSQTDIAVSETKNFGPYVQDERFTLQSDVGELSYSSVPANLSNFEQPVTVNSNAANTTAIQTLENAAGDIQLFRSDASPEGSITGSIGDRCVDGTNGVMYIKGSGNATNTGWEIVGGTPSYKSFTLADPGNAGTFYIGGHYDAAAAHAVLTIGGTVTQTFGTANEATAAHAFVVASGAGGTDLVLTVSGTSITDAGVRTTSDTEIIVADTDAAITNQKFETTKKWLGQVTFTLTGSAGAFTFNYGHVKYDDFGDKDFTLTDFEATGFASANETDLNIEVLHHAADKFVYHATAFVPNATPLFSLGTDYGTDNNIGSGEYFSYKRNGLSQVILGDDSEGLLIRVTTAVNNSINCANFHVGVNLT